MKPGPASKEFPKAMPLDEEHFEKAQAVDAVVVAALARPLANADIVEIACWLYEAYEQGTIDAHTLVNHMPTSFRLVALACHDAWVRHALRLAPDEPKLSDVVQGAPFNLRGL